MANLEQVEIMKKGVLPWNEWRDAAAVHPELTHANFCGAKLTLADQIGCNVTVTELGGTNVTEAKLGKANCCELFGINLSEANLTGAQLADSDLTLANLRLANLTEANLRDANLRDADLSNADLSGAQLAGADLTVARLSHASLVGANLMGANLMGADLVGADLRDVSFCNANLRSAKVTGANLAGAVLHGTILADIDLSEATGLDAVKHEGPSTIGLDTFFNSKGKIPVVFLRGAGIPDAFLQYAASLAGQPFEFYSCFISYSHDDKSFARRLHDELQAKGIRCWLDEKQLRPGDYIHEEIDKGIRLWDKVLLCCSKSSLSSWWVDKEISKAVKKEEQLWKERGNRVLAIIPLNLDGFMFDPQWQDWKKQDLTGRLAADFIGWDKDNGKFEEQLEEVVKALRADAGARPQPPKPRL